MSIRRWAGLALAWVGATALGTGCGRTLPDPGEVEAGRLDVGPSLDARGPSDAGGSSCDAPDLDLAIESDRTEVDLSDLLPSLAPGQVARVQISRGVTVSSAAPERPALTTGELPDEVEVCLVVRGRILGAGGAGGSGGSGAPGRASRRCGRDGQRGGTAVEFVTAGRIEVRAGGLIGGGGGGGGGASSCDLNAGGGGGAGTANGPGGEGASGRSASFERAFCGEYGGVTVGVPGEAGTALEGGRGGVWERGVDRITGGRGGDIGRPGQPGRDCRGTLAGEGGLPGYSIVLGPEPVERTGDGDVEGPVFF